MLSNLEIIGLKFPGQRKFGCQRNFLNPIISKLDKHMVLLLKSYIDSQLLGIAQSKRILHGGEKILIFSLLTGTISSSCQENIKVIFSS